MSQMQLELEVEGVATASGKAAPLVEVLLVVVEAAGEAVPLLLLGVGPEQLVQVLPTIICRSLLLIGQHLQSQRLFMLPVPGWGPHMPQLDMSYVSFKRS
jgi:hypothetical protein